jgi:ubiquinone/menaquinone biosynthesis C-methylase UbiE
MRRVDAPELLDSEDCPPEEITAALQTLDRINRWFGGVATTQKMVERVSSATRAQHLSLLEVAAGSGKVPLIVGQQLARRGITLEITLLDRRHSHLPVNDGAANDPSAETSTSQIPCSRSVAANALALPFVDDAFDLVSCNLFAHHLNPEELARFVKEALRVCRRALLINDLVRHPLHLALVYASYAIMGSRIAWRDGLTSVRRAYVPEEMRDMIASALPQHDVARTEISRHYLFRMGVIVWKNPAAV